MSINVPYYLTESQNAHTLDIHPSVCLFINMEVPHLHHSVYSPPIMYPIDIEHVVVASSDLPL